MEALQLHDIKGLVTIPDDSIYYFYGLISLLIVTLIIASVFIYKFLHRDKALNLQKYYKEQLNTLDLTQPKSSAYLLTYYAELLDKTPEQSELFEDLLGSLETYKYKKDVPHYDEETQTLIQNFLDGINV